MDSEAAKTFVEGKPEATATRTSSLHSELQNSSNFCQQPEILMVKITSYSLKLEWRHTHLEVNRRSLVSGPLVLHFLLSATLDSHD